MGVLVTLIYANTFSSPFVFDDNPNILENSKIRTRSLSLADLTKVGFDNLISTRPVAYISFALNYYYHGYRMGGYHLVNLLVHLFTGIILYYLLKITLLLMNGRHPFAGGDRVESAGASSEYVSSGGGIFIWVPLLSAFIWLVHPLATQSVTYIVQRMNSMAALFYILSMLFYIKARIMQRLDKPAHQEQPVSSSGSQEVFCGLRKKSKALPIILCFAGCGLCALFAIGSKEIAATLPFFIMLYEWYFFQDLNMTWLRKYALFFVAVFVALNLLLFIFAWEDLMTRLAPAYQEYDFTPRERVLTQFRVIFLYLGLLVFPAPWRLNLEYDFLLSTSMVAPLSTLMAFTGLVGLVVISVWTAKQHRLLSFTILWFLGNLAIESSIIPLDMVYEHRTYLPSMFPVFLTLFYLFRWSRFHLFNIALCTLVIMLFSIWTYQRNQVWASEVSLWQDCVKKSPGSKRSQNNLGLALFKVGKIDLAMDYYKHALNIDQEYGNANGNMGLALYKKGLTDDAIAYFKKANAANPNLLHVRINLGNALLSKGMLADGIRQYEKAVEIDGSSALAWRNLGLANLRQGKMRAAIFYFSRAIELEPENQKALVSRRLAEGLLEQFIQGVDALEKSMAVDPNEPEIEKHIDVMVENRLALDRLLDQYASALSSQPGFSREEIEERNMLPLHQAKLKYDVLHPLFKQLMSLPEMSFETAYVKASIYAVQDHSDRSIQWLEQAISKGFIDRVRIEIDMNLANIRDHAEYHRLLDNF